MIFTYTLSNLYKTASLTLTTPFQVTATATEAAGVFATNGWAGTTGLSILGDLFGRSWYAEFTLTAMGAGKNIAVGFKTIDDSLTSKPGADATSFGYDASTNEVRLNGAAAAGTGWAAPVQGDIVSFKIDENSLAITAYLNGANPVAVGTLTAAAYVPCVYVYDSGDSVTANFGGADGVTFTYLPASTQGWNYQAWPGSASSALLTPYDKTASIDISGYGMIATATAVNTTAGVRSLTYRIIGTGSGGGPDRYCEFTLTTMAASEIAVGLLTSDDAVASVPGNVATSAGYYVSTNLVKADNGTGVATGWTTPVAGDVIGMRVNMTTRVITFYKNGVASSNTVTLGTAGSYAPAIRLYTQNDVVTFNAGGPTGVGFAYLPAGCWGWNYEIRETRTAPKTVASPRPMQHIRL